MPNPFSFSGRMGRVAYVAYSVLYTVVSAVIALLLLMSLPGGGSVRGQASSTIGYMFWVLVSVYLITTLATTAKRLHDMNRSGWWAALLIIPGPNAVLALMLLLAPGTPGANRFGER